MAYKNKEDQAKAAKKHYLNNKDKIKERAKHFKNAVRIRNREFVNDYLSTHPCIDCGESNVIVLEFDHIKGEKVNCIANAVNRGWSINRIEKEIEKCVIRCANCHRIKTHGDRQLKY